MTEPAQGWSVGNVDPEQKIPVATEIQAKQGDQIREAPRQAAADLEILQEQDGSECHTKLDPHSVGEGAQKSRC